MMNDIEDASEETESYDFLRQVESVRRVSGRQCGQNKCLVMGKFKLSNLLF